MIKNGEVSSLVTFVKCIPPDSFAWFWLEGDYLLAANENNPEGARTPVTMWVGGVTPSLKSALFPQLGGDGNSEKNTEEEQ